MSFRYTTKWFSIHMSYDVITTISVVTICHPPWLLWHYLLRSLCCSWHPHDLFYSWSLYFLILSPFLTVSSPLWGPQFCSCMISLICAILKKKQNEQTKWVRNKLTDTKPGSGSWLHHGLKFSYHDLDDDLHKALWELARRKWDSLCDRHSWGAALKATEFLGYFLQTWRCYSHWSGRACILQVCCHISIHICLPVASEASL